MENGCERSAKSGATGALLDMQPGQGLIRPSPQSNERDPLVLGHAVGCPRGLREAMCAKAPCESQCLAKCAQDGEHLEIPRVQRQEGAIVAAWTR